MIPSALSIVVAILTPALIQYCKSQPWVPFFRHHAPRLNAIGAAVVAVAQSVGIAIAFSGDTLTVSGLNAVANATMGATALLAWLVQELSYRLTIRR